MKKLSLLITIKLISKFKFLDSAIKYSKGIGYQGSLQFEIDLLIGKESSRFILFDIGANIGDYSLAAARRFPNCTIYSFEPSKATFDKLVENTRFFSNIICVQIAFGEITKQANLYSDTIASGLASLFNRDLSAYGTEFKQMEVVNVQRLDDWISTNNINPNYLKIDVEGSELSVLKGGINSLRNIKAVQFEFGGTAIDAKTYFKDFWNFLTSLNFVISRYTPTGLYRIENYSESEEIFEFMNYVAVPNKLVD